MNESLRGGRGVVSQGHEVHRLSLSVVGLLILQMVCMCSCIWNAKVYLYTPILPSYQAVLTLEEPIW